MRSEQSTLYYKLYHEIKQKIINHELQENTKLESVRSCALKNNISTTTVEKAYNQLAIEGYVTSVPRSGFTVNNIKNILNSNTIKTHDPINHKDYPNTGLTDDLFDIKTFKSITNKVYNYYTDDLYKENHPFGEELLREEIRKHILRERNVKCSVDQIVIGPGIQTLLNIILSITKGKTVSYLTPEFTKAMTIFRGYNFQLKAFQSIDDIIKEKSDFLYLSPSNTYPTGDVLGINDRNKLIKWAHKNQTYIIEDDYNFFIRYNSYTIPSMHSIDDQSHVIYMGSFSKTLLPSIRISYMVLPIPLYNLLKNNYTSFSQGVSKVTQLSVALYMKEGLYKRHTKKLYNKYALKNELLLKELNEIKDDSFSIRSTDSNLHIVIDFTNQKMYKQVISNLQKCGYSYNVINNTFSIIFPYSGLQNNKIKDVIQKLFKKDH